MRVDRLWYSKNPLSLLLWPLSQVFRVLAMLRRLAYALGILRTHKLRVPVVVVGNITVGGTGKTPLVIWLANYLKSMGYQPGIVSRGYGGKASQWPQQVRPDSDPKVVGDEAIIIARHTRCPMAAGPDRVAAAQALLTYAQCDIIISDDGLQHYALARDIEIAVIDGVRRFGNGFFLPAGPLREAPRRLKKVDFVVANGVKAGGEILMRMQVGKLRNINFPNEVRDLEQLRGRVVHAVAAIGNPERFYRMLAQAGVRGTKHEFADHYFFKPADITFNDNLPVIMTEKDAVKCQPAPGNNYWYLMVRAVLEERLGYALVDKLQKISGVRRQAVNQQTTMKRSGNGQETAGHSGVPNMQRPTGTEKRRSGTGMQGRPSGVSDTRRHPGHAGTGSALPGGGRGGVRS